MLQNLPAASKHQGDILNRCAALIAAGKFRPLVSTTLPLAEAAQAHRMIRFAHPAGRLPEVQRAKRFCPAYAGMTKMSQADPP